jgi:DNA-binding transcriptional LysR family regulator
MAKRSLRHWEHRIGRRLHLRDLHILLTVAQSGSMVRAAHELSMSQPAVSKAIATLEDALGIRLLDRTAQGVEPTRYGWALLRRGAAVFDELRQGVSEIEYLSEQGVGELRVGYGEPLAITLVTGVITTLISKHPRLIVHLRRADTIALDFRDLRDRNVDLMVGRVAMPFREEDLDAETILQHSVVVVAGAQSPWVRRRKIKLVDLVDEKWILLPPELPESEWVASAFRSQGLKPPRARVTTVSLHMRAVLLERGDFLSAFPPELLSRYPSIKALPVHLGLQARPIAIVRLKNRTLTPAAELFISELRTAAKASESKPAAGRLVTAP